jgi:hypothetical protein
MSNFIIVAGLALGLVASAPESPPPGAQALHEIRIDRAALSASDEQTFGILMHARSPQSPGTLTFKSHLTLRTVLRDDAAVLDDEWQIGSRTYRTKRFCRMDGLLSLDRAEVTMVRRGQQQVVSLRIEDGTLLADHEGKKIELPYPAGTVGQSELFRLIPMLPRTPGAAWTFDGYCEAIEMKPRVAPDGERFWIECMGEATIEADGRDVTCTKYTLVTNERVDYYVDDASALRRIVADNGDTVLIATSPERIAGGDVAP